MCFEILFQYMSQHDNSIFLGPGVVVYVISAKEIASIYFSAFISLSFYLLFHYLLQHYLHQSDL